jgi:hypothetical protein
MGDRGFGGKNSWIRGQLAISLGRELWFEGLKQKFGEEELQKKLASLNEDDKAELYSLPGDDGRSVLKMRIFREAWQDTQAVQDFFELGGFGRSGFGSGRGDGRDGRGEPGRGDGPERRNDR